MVGRGLLPSLAAAALVLSAAGEAHAQSFLQFSRGEGGYLSVPKLVVVWLVFLLWVRTCNWVNADGQYQKQDIRIWNPLMVGCFLVALLVMLLIPYFWLLGFPLLLIAYAVPLGLYVHQRNAPLHESERVLTPGHIWWVIATQLNRLGLKLPTEKRTSGQGGPPIELEARGAEDDKQNQANLIRARQSPAFPAVKQLLFDAIQQRGDAILLDYNAEAVAIRYQIDGLWQPQDNFDRESGDAVVAVLMTLAALNPGERRRRASGEFAAQQEKIHWSCKLVAEATKAGQRVLLRLDDGGVRFQKLADLGMREKSQTQLAEIMGRKGGFVLFSAPSGQGLTTTFYAALNTVDRYTRSLIAVEDEADPGRPVDNIVVRTYSAARGESPATVLPKVFREYPDGIVVRDPVNAETVNLLLGQATTEKRTVFSSVRARDCADALVRIAGLGVDPADLAEAVSAVVNQRLVRKLCESCKEGFTPSPAMLKQLGLPPGKISTLYRPPQEPEKVCPACRGLGYVGRTGLFEVLAPDDTVRKVLSQSPINEELLRQAVRRAGAYSFQQEGILLVAKGVTSLEELKRVLKEG